MNRHERALGHHKKTNSLNRRHGRRGYHTKGIENIFSIIIEENFPNLKKEMPIKVKEAYRTANRLNQKQFPLAHNNKNMKCTEQKS